MKKISNYVLDYLPQDPDTTLTLKEHMELTAKKRGKSKFAFMGQTHSDHVALYDGHHFYDDSDAIISKEEDVLLLAQFADCVPIYVYNNKQCHYAMIHSGWKGTQKNILSKVLLQMIKDGSSAKDLFVVIGPCISKKNYEVGEEFKTHFDSSYIIEEKGHLYLDLRKVVNDQALAFVAADHITVDERCTFDEKELHSYRRDGAKAKRNIGSIIYET